MASSHEDLPLRPRLHRSYYTIEIPHSDDVLLYREGRGVRLKPAGGSELLGLLLDALDGTRTVTEIVTALGQYDSTLVVSSLRSLHKKGLLEDGDAPSAGSRDPDDGGVLTLISNLAPERISQIRDALTQATVVVAGSGTVASSLMGMLDACGVTKLHSVPADAIERPPVSSDVAGPLPDTSRPGAAVGHARISAASRGLIGGASLVVAALDHPDPDLLEAVNDVCLDHPLVFLPAVLVGGEGRLGPACVPGQTACVVCASLRAKSNLSRYEEYLLYEDAMRRRPGERRFGRLPHFPALLAGVTATEAFKLITHAYPATTLGRVVIMDLLMSESESHDVLRVPRCPACGRLARRAQRRNPYQHSSWGLGRADAPD